MGESNQTRLIDISPKAWEHPADRAALSAMRAIPGMDVVLRALIGSTIERMLRLHTLANAVRITENQMPQLHYRYRQACEILDVKEVPELYVTQFPFLNASAIGVDKPFIVLNSSVVNSMKDPQILAVLGHELAHCVNGHALYKTLLAVLLRLGQLVSGIPLTGISIWAIMQALREWDRKSELTADRAGLLVTQNAVDSYGTLMQMAGGTQLGNMNFNEFLQQAQDYEAGEGIVDSVYKMMDLVGQTHPFPVLRITQLKRWIDSGAYDKIIGGDYLRRSEAQEEDFFENVGEAAGQYKEDFASSQDPLDRIMTGAVDVAEGVVEQTRDFFDTIFRGKRAANGTAENGEAQ